MTAYYIDGTLGLEANDGLSSGAPKKDWSGDIGRADGDVVNLACGTTILMTVANNATGSYTIQSYGTGAKPIVRMPQYATAHFFFNAPAKGPIVTISGIRFERIDTGDIGANGDNIGVFSIGGETVIVEDCEFIGKFQNAIEIGWGDNCIVRRNLIDGALNNGIFVGTTGQTAPSYGEYSDNTIRVPNASNDPITLHDGNAGGVGNKILRNKIYSGKENCVDILNAYSGTQVIGNYLEAGTLSGTTASGNALITCGTPTTIKRNTLVSIRTTCLEFVSASASGSVVDGNLCFGPYETIPSGGQIVSNTANNINVTYTNNTFIGRASSGVGASMFQWNAATASQVFKNNLVIKPTGDSFACMFWVGNVGPVGTLDYNHYVMPATGTAQYCGKTFSAFKTAFSCDAHSTETTTSPIDDDGFPLADSAILNAGVHLGPATDLAGMHRYIPPTIGAREWIPARARTR